MTLPKREGEWILDGLEKPLKGVGFVGCFGYTGRVRVLPGAFWTVFSYPKDTLGGCW